ncbi:hypothetical protein ACJIZ3_013317 [Penstemon smallii]|uniref:Senescence regulator n=1 Tax=Penstemon smallii TaxID=265156 RepID=A0ABD3UPV6_9LAMI
MAEEFQESEIIFQENFEFDEETNNEEESRNYNNGKRKKLKTVGSKKSSVPVNIPQNLSRENLFRYVDTDLDGGDNEIVPPHIIIGRRVAGKMMAFSVCTGNGRTLKGRDLSEVRNSILRMTGFLET